MIEPYSRRLIALAEQAPSIRRILAPNAFRPEGVCMLDGNVPEGGLTLDVDVSDAVTGRPLASTTVPARDRQTGFRLPKFVADRKCRLVARLLEPGDRIIDAASATVFGAQGE